MRLRLILLGDGKIVGAAYDPQRAVNADDVDAIVAVELARNEPFNNYHGITADNIRHFLVKPSLIWVEPVDVIMVSAPEGVVLPPVDLSTRRRCEESLAAYYRAKGWIPPSLDPISMWLVLREVTNPAETPRYFVAIDPNASPDSRWRLIEYIGGGEGSHYPADYPPWMNEYLSDWIGEPSLAVVLDGM